MELSKIWIPALLALAACSPGEEGKVPSEQHALGELIPGRRVLFIGIDGLEWRLVEPLLAAGEMPNLAGLVARGAAGELHTLEGEGEHSATMWTCIATGKLPEKHGIPHVTFFPPGAYMRRQHDGTDRRVAALWNVASAVGLGAATVFYWMTWPPDEIDGVVVSDQWQAPRIERRAWPAEWSARVESFLPDFHSELDLVSEPALAELIDNPEGLSCERLRELAGPHLEWFRTVRKDAIALELTKRILREEPSIGLTMVYFQGADHFQHFLWRFMEPQGFEVSREAIAAFGQVIPRYLRALDRHVGELLAFADEETLVVVASDHGFRKRIHRYETAADPLLVALGLQARDGWRIVPRRTLLFDRETRPTKRVRLLRMNVAGREPKGVIPATLFAERRQRLMDLLAGLRTSDGQALYARVEAVDAAQTGADIRLHCRPVEEIADLDLVVREHRLPIRELFPLQPRSGDHRPQGVLVLAGPDVAAGTRLEGAEIVDVAPTVLYLLNQPVGADMDGKLLESALAPGALEARPLVTVPSLDWSYRRQAPARAPAEVEAANLDRLRALGYTTSR